MRKSLASVAAVAFALCMSVPAQAAVRAGVLTCTVSPGVGLIVGSQKTVSCVFESVRGGRERYTGRITRIGLDVGFTTGGTIIWAVYAPSQPGRGTLAGGYGGASAEASIAAGIGANALIGGFRKSITLQPLSIGTQKGFDIAVAVSGLELEYTGR